MGIIVKQSIKGSLWSYLGVVVGFVTTAYLFPNYLSTDTIGLFTLLLSWSILFAQLASLGFQGVTSRLFPWFRDKESQHNGFLSIAFVVTLIGFLLFVVLYWSLESWLVESNLEKSKLFADYLWLLIPLTFFTLIFNQLDIFNKLLYDAVLGTFLQEFLQRILIFAATLMFVIGLISLNMLILLYAASVSFKGLFILIYLLIKGEIGLKFRKPKVDPPMQKEMFSVALFGILTGLGGNIVFHIDKILINQFLGLSSTGIYSIGFFFGALVIIPSRTLLRISGTLIAEAFKRDDIPYIDDLYKKSCLNQSIIGAFLFGGILINIKNILILLGPQYAGTQWVIIFIGLGYLVDMATGANAQIIAYSVYYKVALYFILILIVLVVVTIIILVPLWGITGAAVAIFISIVANNFMRYLFLKRKFNMTPFDRNIFYTAIILIVALFIAALLPSLFYITDIFLRSLLFTVVFGGLILLFNISDEVTQLKKSIISFLFKR